MTEQMKPSGIAWIKEIPQSWELNKVKYLATEPETLFLDGDWIESDVIVESGIRYLTTGNVGAGFYKDQGSGYITQKTFDELHCLKVFPGDLMMSRLNEPIGRACIVPEGEDYYVVAVDNVILRPNEEYDKKFIMYAMNTEGYAEHGNMIARGATMSRVSRSQLGQFWLAFPKLKEQQQIAAFLDDKCSKIDGIIADIEKQIEILQKYKKSLITEAVTKGLERSVPMKNSGMKNVDDIPQGWSVQRLKYVSRLKTGTTPAGNEGINYEGQGIPWFTPSDFIPSLELEKSEKFVDDETINREGITPYPANSVLLVAIGATVGKIGITKSKGYSNQQITAIIPTGIDSKYLLYYLFSKADYIKDNALYTTLPIINNAYLSNIPVIIPSEQEQKDITEYLDRRCSLISKIICDKEKQLKTVQQHKKSLIYEYVTGKKRATEVN